MDLPTDYRISTNKTEMDTRAIHAYLTRSYWSSNIPIETVETAIQNSLCFALFKHTKQIGFARLISDSATFAYLCDVYILEDHRGQGLSKFLMQEIIQHPQLQGLRRMVLATRDAHSLYAQYGFKPLANPPSFMELWQPDVYKNA